MLKSAWVWDSLEINTADVIFRWIKFCSRIIISMNKDNSSDNIIYKLHYEQRLSPLSTWNLVWNVFIDSISIGLGTPEKPCPRHDVADVLLLIVCSRHTLKHLPKDNLKLLCLTIEQSYGRNIIRCSLKLICASPWCGWWLDATIVTMCTETQNKRKLPGGGHYKQRYWMTWRNFEPFYSIPSLYPREGGRISLRKSYHDFWGWLVKPSRLLQSNDLLGIHFISNRCPVKNF